MSDELKHHQRRGAKWGEMNGPPYPLDREAKIKAGYIRDPKKRAKRDKKFIKRNERKIYKKAYDASKKELSDYVKNELNPKYNSTLKHPNHSRQFINDYNRKMAELMTKNVSDLRSPSGKVIAFVAKRGEVGVHTALADQGYDFSSLKNGVWGNGRIAYKKTEVNKM